MDQFSTDTSQIRSWRSIITLIVFVVTNTIVLFPFHIRIPRCISDPIQNTLRDLEIMPDERSEIDKGLRFPVNFVTAPLIADLFLLAILAIGKTEVHDGTLGANNILPYNIMIFFLTLAYIAISIDCSGLIRLLALRVLKKGGKQGRLLFLFLYIFFFALGSFIGNDPIILSGTAFLAYMTRVSSNIEYPRAWIHTQFAIANIASAILVSSNPTNLVLAGAFGIKFITYTANMVVPVFVTFIVLFPFLLFVIFKKEKHIPRKIEGDWLLKEQTDKKPVDPNIPDSRELAEGQDDPDADEVLNPYINKESAIFGAFVMSATLITLLVVNASDQKEEGKETPVFYITLPAAFIMFCWDLGSGWLNREETRKIAEEALEKKKARVKREREGVQSSFLILPLNDERLQDGQRATTENETQELARPDSIQVQQVTSTGLGKEDEEKGPGSIRISANILRENDSRKPIIARFISRALFAQWRLRATFPTVTAVLSLLPYKLLPFAFSMFVLVQGLVAQGWVAVFAYGWDYWVNTTGTVGAITGMAFVSVILCNFAGTNIGTTILLCRVIQTWKQIHVENRLPISDRTLWGTIYAMALGVNYGAFSAAFSASLAGLLWRDILEKKEIPVKRLDFARINMPIISIAMAVGCATLILQNHVTRSDKPFDT